MQLLINRLFAPFKLKIQLSLALLALALPKQLVAQQAINTAQFMNNQMVYNPAATGMLKHNINLGLLSHLSWLDIEGAPRTYLLWGDYRFAEKRMAVGINVMNDTYGINSNTEIAANYSYYIDFGNDVKLSMGLKAGASNFSRNFSKLSKVTDEGDPALSNEEQKEWLPKFGAGFYLTTRKFYAGIAAPDLLIYDQNNILGNDDKSFFEKRRNYALHGGAIFNLGDQYAIKPAVIAYTYPQSGVTVDINGRFEVVDYFWAGATYSTTNSYALMAGTHLTARIVLGYAFRHITIPETSVSFNSHEINLVFSLDKFL